MSSFTDDLVVSPLADGRRWELDKEFDYRVGAEDSGIIIHVPVGFITDFASIPKIFWNILPPWGQYGKAAVLHDYLYGNQGKFSVGAATYMFSRKECDGILLEAMGVLGVNGLTKWLIYNNVRWFGGWAWDNDKKKGGDLIPSS